MCKSAEELEVLSRNPVLQIFDWDTAELRKPKSIFTWSQECLIHQQKCNQTLTSGFGSPQDHLTRLQKNHC